MKKELVKIFGLDNKEEFAARLIMVGALGLFVCTMWLVSICG